MDTADIPDTCPPFPPIIERIADIFSLSPEHVCILVALFTFEDIEAISNMKRQTTHRTQMKILADIAGTDVTTFVQQTAPGSTLERLGLIAYRGGRDEIADMSVNRPLLFALRSDTPDDLRAGLFDHTPQAPQDPRSPHVTPPAGPGILPPVTTSPPPQ
jgi:primosomal replication protein N